MDYSGSTGVRGFLDFSLLAVGSGECVQMFPTQAIHAPPKKRPMLVPWHTPGQFLPVDGSNLLHVLRFYIREL